MGMLVWRSTPIHRSHQCTAQGQPQSAQPNADKMTTACRHCSQYLARRSRAPKLTQAPLLQLPVNARASSCTGQMKQQGRQRRQLRPVTVRMRVRHATDRIKEIRHFAIRCATFGVAVRQAKSKTLALTLSTGRPGNG